MIKLDGADSFRNSVRTRGRDCPANQKFNENVHLCEVRPAAAPGEFTAIVNGELVVWSSRTPLFDAARALLGRGVDSNSWLILRHAGSDTDCLRGKVGILAKLTVKQPDRGRIHLARYVPLVSSPVPSHTRQRSEAGQHGPV